LSMDLKAERDEVHVTIRYKGDDNENARLLLEWKRNDRTSWSATSYSWDRRNKLITSVISGLDQGSEYDVRAMFMDDTTDIVYGENPIARSVQTPVTGVGPLMDARISFGGFVLMGPNTT